MGKYIFILLLRLIVPVNASFEVFALSDSSCEVTKEDLHGDIVNRENFEVNVGSLTYYKIGEKKLDFKDDIIKKIFVDSVKKVPFPREPTKAYLLRAKKNSNIEKDNEAWVCVVGYPKTSSYFLARAQIIEDRIVIKKEYFFVGSNQKLLVFFNGMHKIKRIDVSP